MYKCPDCKSDDVMLYMGGQFNKYECKCCGYIGPFILEINNKQNTSEKMNKSKKTIKKYNRIARFCDFLTKFSEDKMFKRYKEKYFSNLKGNILEVGVGTGRNLEYYNKKAKVIGIDFSDKMLERARENLKKLGNKNIILKRMDIENLKFKDNSFDYIVSTCVFCSVPNPIKGLKEIKRVLKPKGKLIMIEHVLSKNKLIALIEYIHNPITRFILGVNINRNTKQNISLSGMKIVKDENLALFDVFKLFIASKKK